MNYGSKQNSVMYKGEVKIPPKMPKEITDLFQVRIVHIQRVLHYWTVTVDIFTKNV